VRERESERVREGERERTERERETLTNTQNLKRGVEFGGRVDNRHNSVYGERG